MRNAAFKIVAVTLVVASLFALPSASHAWHGWRVAGIAAGGVLLGSAVTRPWRSPAPVYVYQVPRVVYAYPPPQVVYSYPAPPAVYAYPAPAFPVRGAGGIGQ